MSEIFVDTIKNKAGSTSLDSDKLPDMYSGSARAWADANGTGTVSMDDSFNISSMDDDGTGDYGFNFTSAFASTAYCPQATGRGDGTGEGAWCTSTRVPATSSCDIAYWNSSGTAQDQTALSWSALGDLA